MDILTTKLPTFEQIDNELCSSRPKTLKIIKFKERSILTDFGMLTFKRRDFVIE